MNILNFRVKCRCPRLLINREKVGGQDRLSKFFGMKSGLNFESALRKDVAWLGDCDIGVQLLADKMDWGVSENSYEKDYNILLILFQYFRKN